MGHPPSGALGKQELVKSVSLLLLVLDRVIDMQWWVKGVSNCCHFLHGHALGQKD